MFGPPPNFEFLKMSGVDAALKNTPSRIARAGIMPSSGSGQANDHSVAHRLVMNDMDTTVLKAKLKKVLGILHDPGIAQYAGMTNSTEAGKAALRSKADEFGSQLADLEDDRLSLEQLQKGSSTPAVGGETGGSSFCHACAFKLLLGLLNFSPWSRVPSV